MAFTLKRLSVPKRLRVLVMAALFLLIPLLSYFYLYISNQTSYFTNRNFRELASVGLQVEQRIENLKEAFGNAVENTVEKNYESQQPPKNAVARPEAQPLRPPSQLPLPTFKQSLAALSAGFVINGDEPRIPKYTNSEDLKRELGGRKIEMEVITAGETSKLIFVWKLHSILENKVAPGASEFRAEIELADLVNPLIGKRHIESIRGSEHEGFDAILIGSLEDYKQNASSQALSEPSVVSRIVFQQGTPELDIDSLDNLPRADTTDKTIDLKALSRSTGSTDVRLADTSYKMYLQPLEIPLPTIVPGGQGAPKDQVGSRWVICGVVQASHFRRETWAFPYTWLIMLAFVAALVALSWPFLKLLFSGPKDRLRLGDVYFMAFALLIGSAILTFFLLFGFTYPRSENDLDGQLVKFSQEIADHFSTEVSSALAEIDRLNQDARLTSALNEIEKDSEKQDSRLKPSSKKIEKGDSEGSRLVSVRNQFQRINILEKAEDETTPILSVDDPYPYFLKAVWMDRAGQMRLMWTIGSSTSYLKSVSDRDFFKKLMEGNSRRLGGEQSGARQSGGKQSSREPFWLEPINSRLTGAKTVIISEPHKSEDPNRADEIKSIAAIDPSLMSLMQTVVPSGFGYRVIDNSGHDPGDEGADDPGKVIFRSSESQKVRENFFEECDNNHSLRSLIFGRDAGFVDVNYGGEDHRLYVSPINGFPNWSLVVFRNKRPLRTVYLETLTLAGFILLLYALLLLLVFIGIYLMKIITQDRTEWIWPSKKTLGIHKQSLLTNLILCLLSAILILEWDGRNEVLSVGGIAFFGMIFLALRLKRKWFFGGIDRALKFGIDKIFAKRKTTRTYIWIRTHIWNEAYIWNVTALLVLMGILPAVAFFKVAYNEEMTLFLKHGQITIARGLEEREALVRSQYSTERADVANNPPPIKDPQHAKEFIKQRLNNPLDVYDDFFFETKREFVNESSTEQEKIKEAPDGLVVLFSKFVPLFNETSIEMGGLTRNHAADKSWQWETPENHLILHIPSVQVTAEGDAAQPANRSANNEASKPEEALHITTPLQRFGPMPPPTLFLLLWTLGFLVIYGGLFYLTRIVLRKVFLLDLHDETNDLWRLPNDKQSIKQNLFVVENLPLVDRDGLFPDQFLCIDLMKESQGEGWVKKIVSTSKSGVVVGHFEYQMSNPSMNAQKVQLVEGLVEAKKRVVILSLAEPTAYVINKERSKKKSKSKNRAIDSGDRWAEMISGFRKVYSVDNDDAKIETAISEKRGTVATEDEERFEKLAQLVSAECSPQAFLHTIGKEIVEQTEFETIETHDILDQILDRAELYYRKIWDNCSDCEKLTLCHLAEDRLLSPNDPDIKSLLRRGIIVRALDIELMNKTFRTFVYQQSLGGGLESAEILAKKTSPWEALKVPLFVAFVGAVLFLVLTQKDFYSSSWTVVTALTTGIPAVFKLLSLFQGESTGPKIFHA